VVDNAFRGFTPAAIQFMADLALNNDRAWFQPRKGAFEALVKVPMEQLVAALAERFRARGIPLEADPGRSPFRIYRDVRFSRDKSPYKTHLGASFPWAEGMGRGETTPEARGEGRHASGGYFSFQPGEMFAGGGLWMPSKRRLDAFRRLVIDDPDRVTAALEDPAFVAWFGGANGHEALKRVPRGYPADHPKADLLRWKSVVFGRRLSDADVCSPDLPDLLAEGYATAVPVLRFLVALG
jgi:uncharacterized protein (TIGR02453 family)